MSNSDNKIGVLGLLGVVFVTLKLCKVIHWSWLWVTCPFWIGIASITFMLIIGLVIIIISAITALLRHGKYKPWSHKDNYENQM